MRRLAALGIKQDLLFKIAKRWISGKDIGEALEVAKQVNEKGMGAVVNYLGEDVSSPIVAEKHADEYLRLIRAIAERRIDGCVSVKLTQFGLGADERSARDRTEGLAKEAEALDQLLWLDMEGSRYTDITLKIYHDLHNRFPNLGVALQAYLRRSADDLAGLVEKNARVRLVKGAYREPPQIAYGSREEIRENYSRLMKILFEKSSNFAVATHDSALIDEARALARSHRVTFEFEMLKGIRDELKLELVKEGYRMVDYIPYGDQWYGYSIRRMREHPSNIWLLLRSLL